MEDLVEENEAVLKDRLDDKAIRRTQSSLELLSDTALAAMSSQIRHDEPEESSSAGSGDTSFSARVTPFPSQASMGVGIATSADNRHEVGEACSEEVISKQGAQKTAPSSPHVTFTSQSSFASVNLSEFPGLPIDYPARSTQSHPAPKPQRLYLPSSYIPPVEPYVRQPMFFQPPSSVGLPPAVSCPEATHAAFLPPRSTTIVRLTKATKNESEQPHTTSTHYPGVVADHLHRLPPLNAHPMRQQQHHAYVPATQEQERPHRFLSGSLKLCESFQSDSTGSLVSETKTHTIPKGAFASSGQTTQQLQGHPAVKGKSAPDKNSLLAPEDRSKTNEALVEANEQLRRENIELKNELENRDKEITVLRGEVRELDLKVKELRQFPAGKISQIPMADMLEIMQTYGSEVSDTVMPPRKLNIQKASVIRQFRRWNPNFLKFFCFKDGKWLPKLGREGELARRRQARKKGQRLPFSGGGDVSPSTLESRDSKPICKGSSPMPSPTDSKTDLIKTITAKPPLKTIHKKRKTSN